MKNYWRYCILHHANRMIDAEVGEDGQLIRVKYELVADLLTYHPRHANVWYFNATRDREIAELDAGYVVANPQLAWIHNFQIES